MKGVNNYEKIRNQQNYERYWWVPDENFTNAVKFADDLENGHHTFSLRVTHGDKEGFTSSDCKILKVMAVK